MWPLDWSFALSAWWFSFSVALYCTPFVHGPSWMLSTPERERERNRRDCQSGAWAEQQSPKMPTEVRKFVFASLLNPLRSKGVVWYWKVAMILGNVDQKAKPSCAAATSVCPGCLICHFVFFCKIILIPLNSTDLIGLLWELDVFVQMWMKFYLACKRLRTCKKADFLVCFSELAFVVVQLLNHFQLFATPWIAAQQASLPSTIFWNLLTFFNCSQISVKKFKEKV